MKVWYIGYYIDWYPRNRVIRKGLKKAGADVTEIQLPPGKLSRYPRLIWNWLNSRIKESEVPDVLIVPEVDLESFPLVYAISRAYRIPIVYDAFYPRYDALVNDEKEVTRDSFKARATFFLEHFAINKADLVLADSSAHADFISSLYQVSRDRFEVVYIGADEELFYPLVEEEEDFLVHYNGFYHRLQGAMTIVKAAHILSSEPKIRFEMYGKRTSSSYLEIERELLRLNLSNMTFYDTIPIHEMPKAMARAKVCLGIFGETGFGIRVFPNKGFQALAMAKPLITRDSPGSREVGKSGEHFVAVPAEDPEALADAIMFLKDHPEDRQRIAIQGKELFDKKFATKPIGEALYKRLTRLVDEFGKK